MPPFDASYISKTEHEFVVKDQCSQEFEVDVHTGLCSCPENTFRKSCVHLTAVRAHFHRFSDDLYKCCGAEKVIFHGVALGLPTVARGIPIFQPSETPIASANAQLHSSLATKLDNIKPEMAPKEIAPPTPRHSPEAVLFKVMDSNSHFTYFPRSNCSPMTVPDLAYTSNLSPALTPIINDNRLANRQLLSTGSQTLSVDRCAKKSDATLAGSIFSIAAGSHQMVQPRLELPAGHIRSLTDGFMNKLTVTFLDSNALPLFTVANDFNKPVQNSEAGCSHSSSRTLSDQTTAVSEQTLSNQVLLKMSFGVLEKKLSLHLNSAETTVAVKQFYNAVTAAKTPKEITVALNNFGAHSIQLKSVSKVFASKLLSRNRKIMCSSSTSSRQLNSKSIAISKKRRKR